MRPGAGPTCAAVLLLAWAGAWGRSRGAGVTGRAAARRGSVAKGTCSGITHAAVAAAVPRPLPLLGAHCQGQHYAPRAWAAHRRPRAASSASAAQNTQARTPRANTHPQAPRTPPSTLRCARRRCWSTTTATARCTAPARSRGPPTCSAAPLPTQTRCAACRRGQRLASPRLADSHMHITGTAARWCARSRPAPPPYAQCTWGHSPQDQRGGAGGSRSSGGVPLALAAHNVMRQPYFAVTLQLQPPAACAALADMRHRPGDTPAR